MYHEHHINSICKISIAQFVLFSIQSTDKRDPLFTWWLNAARKQVGFTYSYSKTKGRTSLFTNVPFTTGNWFQLTLKFRSFHKSKPFVEFYMNENKMAERPLRDFKAVILNTPRNNITISLADMWGRISTMPRVCMQ